MRNLPNWWFLAPKHTGEKFTFRHRPKSNIKKACPICVCRAFFISPVLRYKRRCLVQERIQLPQLFYITFTSQKKKKILIQTGVVFSNTSSCDKSGSISGSTWKFRASLFKRFCVRVRDLTLVDIRWKFYSQRTESKNEQANQNGVHSDIWDLCCLLQGLYNVRTR